jgi:putative MATE family efflux protein
LELLTVAFYLLIFGKLKSSTTTRKLNPDRILSSIVSKQGRNYFNHTHPFYLFGIKRNMNHADKLGTEKIGSLLLKFSLPAIIGMIVNALYNVVDRAFVGQAGGSLAIASITVCFPIMLILMGFGMLIAMGANALISLRLGQQKKDEAEQILGNATTLLVGIPLLLSIIGLLYLKPLLTLFGASTDVLPQASDYMRIVLLGSVFQAIGFGMNNFIRGEGNPKIAMYTMLIGAVLNLILDPIFIFGFGWGIKGAAWATVISMVASATWVLSYYFGGKSHLKLRLKNLWLRYSVVMPIFALGSAPFVMQIAASAVQTILNRQLSIYGGDLAISAMGVVFSVAMLFLMPIFGINQGAQPIIGYNYGARQFDRVKKTYQLASIAATAITTAGFLIAFFFPSAIIALFNRGDTQLIEMGSRAMRTFLFMLPIVGFQIVSANYFQAIGKPRHAMLLSLSRQVLLLIPCLFILPGFWGLHGVFMSGPVSELGSSLLTGIFLLFEYRKLDKNHETEMIAFSTLS